MVCTVYNLQKLSEKQQQNMRIKIAKDVLSRLHRLDVQSNSGYLILDASERENITYSPSSVVCYEDREAKDFLPKIENNCQICALGAMFLSHIRYHDNLKLYESLNPCRSDITSQLQYYFDQHQLDLIEDIFEEFDNIKDNDENELENIFQDISDDKDRLRAIMKNIVKNKGTLVLPVKLSSYDLEATTTCVS